MKTSLRCLSQAILLAAVGLSLSASSLLAQADVSFKANSIHNNMEPTNVAGQIIIYNLPATGTRPGYFGAADSGFNVRASIPAGTRMVAGYGLIMEIEGVAGLTFTVPDPPVSGTPNNLFNASTTVGPAVTQNGGLSIILGETNVDGYQAGGRSLGVVGLHPTANANTAVANNDGLFRVPVQVAGGVTGTFTLEMALGGNAYSGFGQSDGTLMSPAAIFPQANNTIVVRQSRRADLNGDVLIDGEDIQPFISALSGFPAFKAARPWLQADYITDLNQDGAVDGEDIQPFIAVLSGGGSPSAGSPQAIPEPSTLALAAIGATALLARRFRRKA